MLVAFPWSCNLHNTTTGDKLFRCKNYFHIIFNLAILSVRLALYVFDVYIDVLDVRHDCQGNMLDLG